MSAGKAVLLTLGAIAALAGLGLAAAGGFLLWADATQLDEDGFFTSGEVRVTTEQYALTTEDIDLGETTGEWLPEQGDLTFRVTATPTSEGQRLFLGIGPEDTVEEYLADVPHERIVRVDERGDVTYRRESGTTAPAPPGSAAFWDASVEGSGQQTLVWDAAPGEWTLVLMDADGQQGIGATATGAVRFAYVDEVSIGLLVGGLLVILAAVVMLVAATLVRDGAPATTVDEAGQRQGYPLVVQGRLDAELSRGLPLVKWLAVIPHAIVLGFLWAAFVVLTMVAGVAILFTGRYPRGIFDFNVGVLRWSWRVVFYAYGVLGTDRYPPFSLRPDPDYPADLHVAYPAELSRGLVLVKWWLLAIPHYLVVGLFTSGLLQWESEIGEAGDAVARTGTGLIGILAIIVVGALLFTGRYPRGLFDLLMGLQRWVFRVVAYAALMTDDYPPFRLDTGGDDPAGAPPTAPPPGPTAATAVPPAPAPAGGPPPGSAPR